MSDFVIGIPIGIAIGIAIGISIGIAMGKKQKPWPEMTEEEKRNHEIAFDAGLLLLVLGIVVFFWQFFT